MFGRARGNGSNAAHFVVHETFPRVMAPRTGKTSAQTRLAPTSKTHAQGQRVYVVPSQSGTMSSEIPTAPSINLLYAPIVSPM